MPGSGGVAPGTTALVEAGLVAAWARQASWVPGGRLHRLGGLVVVLCDLADQTQQVGLVERDPAEPDAAIGAAEVLFGRAGWRPAFDLAAGAHPTLEAALSAAGYGVVGRRPAMVRAVAPVGRRPDAPPAGVEVRDATVADLAGLVELHAEVFAMARPVARGLLAEGLLAVAGVRLVVVVAAGAVVGSALVHLDRPVAGLVGVAVRPGERRRGIGRALTEAASARAAAAGADAVWLQATPSGEPMYRRAGFVEVGRFEVWSPR